MRLYKLRGFREKYVFGESEFGTVLWLLTRKKPGRTPHRLTETSLSLAKLNGYLSQRLSFVQLTHLIWTV